MNAVILQDLGGGEKRGDKKKGKQFLALKRGKGGKRGNETFFLLFFKKEPCTKITQNPLPPRLGKGERRKRKKLYFFIVDKGVSAPPNTAIPQLKRRRGKKGGAHLFLCLKRKRKVMFFLKQKEEGKRKRGERGTI